MQLSRSYVIERAASTDDTRPQLAHPVLAGERLVATNGHILAVVPVVRDEADTDGPVPAEAFKAARKHPAPGGAAVVIANGDVRVPFAGLSLTRPEAGTFPDWQRVVPTRAVVFSVGIDARLLLALAQAVGADRGGKASVRLDFVTDLPTDGSGERPERASATDAIRVTPTGAVVDGEASAAFGLLMPCRV